jgi:signal transduction histidine kinase
LIRLKHAWQWYTTVHVDDPVRQTMNRGLLLTIAMFIVLAVLTGFAGKASDFPAAMIAIVVLGACVRPTRRGKAYPAWIVVSLFALVIGLTMPPDSFIGENIGTDAIFLLPAALATMTIHPAAGLLANPLIIAILVTRAINLNAPADQITMFATEALLNLSGLTIPLAMLAALFSQILRAYAATNKELAILNTTLEQRVADRTAELAGANAFIEQRAAERAQQVAAVVHDLRHTSVAVDSILSILELDIEDAQAELATIISKIECQISEDATLLIPVTIHRGTIESEEVTFPETKRTGIQDTVSQAIVSIQTLIEKMVNVVVGADNDIRTNLDGQRGLLSDMLDMAQLEADTITLRLAPADLHVLAANVVRLIEPQAIQKHCAIAVTVEGDTSVWCDTKRIERVLHNIIGNALKYTSAFHTNGGGEIHVEVSQGDNGTTCCVTDNGPGISAEDLTKLGLRWHRAEHSTAGASGTGLGLHFCKGVLAASNGDLSIISDGPGQGTTVTIMLPAHEITRRSVSTMV